MDPLTEKIDSSCWRISARLTANDSGSNGTLDYIDLHTAMMDFVGFHRDILKLENADEEIVYNALCFIEELLLTPVSGPRQPEHWFRTTLHTLMTIYYAKGKVQDGGKRFLKELSKSIKTLQD